jgi:2-keto-3-deoxy-L-rhamnonate aldolase RhmA
LLDISRRTGGAAGWGVNNPDDLQRIRSRGFTFIAYGPDYFLLADAARTALAAFRR